MDSLSHGVEIRRKTGYVAENQKMYGWMTVEQICNFVKPFYPTWNDSLAAALVRRFQLDPKAKLRTLSAGQNAKVALTLALAHEPELLVLDDPTSGLDAVVRRDFLESIVGVIHGEGCRGTRGHAGRRGSADCHDQLAPVPRSHWEAPLPRCVPHGPRNSTRGWCSGLLRRSAVLRMP